MKRIAMTLAAMLLLMAAAEAKTLIVYYSFTNNTHAIATDMQSQLPDADLLRIEPAEKGLDYAANGYAIGSALISAIRANPDDPDSYPAIDPVSVDFSAYDDIVVATPLWWSNMAAPMQTFLFANGSRMAGKRMALVVSSASSGISGVEADARRLVPDGVFVSPSLWIRSSQTANCHALNAEWIAQTGIGSTSGISVAGAAAEPSLTVDGTTMSVGGPVDRLSIYDAAGRLLLSTDATTADISRLAPGMYAVRMVQGDNATTVKVAVD